MREFIQIPNTYFPSVDCEGDSFCAICGTSPKSEKTPPNLYLFNGGQWVCEDCFINDYKYCDIKFCEKLIPLGNKYCTYHKAARKIQKSLASFMHRESIEGICTRCQRVVKHIGYNYYIKELKRKVHLCLECWTWTQTNGL